MSYSIAPGAYTLLERRMAVSGGLDVRKAVQYLKEDARLRSVRETLIRCSEVKAEDDDTLKQSIESLLKESNPDAKGSTIDKNVTNWLADDAYTIKKNSAIQLAYALHMPVDYADAWMARLCGEAFHWRNPEDIVWIFGLNNGLNYDEASKLKQRLVKNQALDKSEDKPKAESAEVSTELVRQDVAQLRTEEQLEGFLEDPQGKLGKMHNTAYKFFSKFMDLLKNPDGYSSDYATKDKEMTVRNVITEYLYRKYIPRAKRRGKGEENIGNAVHSAIQRAIAKNWPEETTLSKMKTRKADVTRKVLILLFLATDGGGIEDDVDDEYADEEGMDADEDFESMEMRMNLMLAQCGFAPLDSRSPFDWIVLYCMYADESIFIEDYMRSFLENVFTREAPDATSNE